MGDLEELDTTPEWTRLPIEQVRWITALANVARAARRLTQHWKEYEGLVELGDSQAVELQRALDALDVERTT